MTIPLPVIIGIFLVAVIVGVVYGTPWYSILGVLSPAVMAAMLMLQEWHDKRKQDEQ